MLHREEGKMIIVALLIIWLVSFPFSFNEFNELLDNHEVESDIEL